MANKFEELKSALEKVDSGKLGLEKECKTVDMPDLDNFSIDISSYTLGAGLSSTGNLYSSYPTSGNITINNGGSSSSSSYPWSSASGPYTISTGYESNKISIDGKDADVLINGRSLTVFMEKMEERLAILQPDLEKLEHFDALKKAYEHYKTLEAMCELPKKEDDGS